MWIEGQVTPPPEGLTGPMVIGRNWLLEMVRTESGRSCGFFWAPFAVIHSFPVDDILNGRFVGFSAPTKPPGRWMTASMTFDLGTAPLPTSPQEFITLIAEPRPYVLLENTAATSLSQQAKRLIADNFSRSIAIREVARALHVSHARLTRQFKVDFGLTPVDYRRRLRVSEAIGRLSEGEPILETGYEVGFEDASRFYKNFRTVTGTSPGKCRR